MSQRIVLFQSINPEKTKRGPHFFFPMFFKNYQEQDKAQHEVFYLIKTNNRDQMISMLSDSGVPLNRVHILESRNHRFKEKHECWDMRKALNKLKPDLFHALTYTSEEELPLLRVAQKKVPKLAFTITYNAIPVAFERDDEPRFKKDRRKYSGLFKEIHFHGILSWYDDIPLFIESQDWISPKPKVQVIDSRYCDSSRFTPSTERKQQIVFASALATYKRPLMFIEAIALLLEKGIALKNWEFLLVGQGPEEAAIREKIALLKMEEYVQMLEPTEDISPILNASMAYVSCQDHENFPSLAMNEAMAAGNAIIARPVGRTSLFVHHEKNGYIAEEDSAKGLSEMMHFSHQLTKEYHTPERFRRQVDEFWSKL
jgi:glycosyltransferase involved in cell wall biosynthesis